MNTLFFQTRSAIIQLPSREEVTETQPGEEILTVWGRRQTVTEVYGRGDDMKGRAYVCGYATDGSGTISASMKEGELIRTLPVTQILNSAECDEIEAFCRANGITDALLVEVPE